MAAGLVLDAPPAKGVWTPPATPFAILPGVFKPLAFPDLQALARYIHRERGRRGMRLNARPQFASYNGSDTFAAFAVYWLEEDAERYAFTIAGVGDVRERLEAAIAAANFDQP